MLPMRVILDVRTHLKVCPFESEGMEKDIPCNENQNKAGVAVIISDEMTFI